jgi:hypothetical protein
VHNAAIRTEDRHLELIVLQDAALTTVNAVLPMGVNLDLKESLRTLPMWVVGLVTVGGPYRHIYIANISPKRKNYMFLHTYTFATNQILLVPEELTLCRIIHQIQVEYIKKAPFGKA